MNERITVILNGYKRPHVLAQQLKAVQDQTVKPIQIMFWKNKSDAVFDNATIAQCESFLSSTNVGVYGRFALALLAEGDYVCIFDDDTVPGSRWLENCITENKKRRGLYGTIGVFFDTHQGYAGPIRRVGWANPIEETTQVDIVGHSWFFEKQLLEYFWREIPSRRYYLCGEDMHFSYMLQKHAGLPTLVPPHPKDNLDLYGSIPELAIQYGMETVGISWGNNCNVQFNEYLYHICRNGFKLLIDEQSAKHYTECFKFVDVYDQACVKSGSGWAGPYEFGMVEKFIQKFNQRHIINSIYFMNSTMPMVNRFNLPSDEYDSDIVVNIGGLGLNTMNPADELIAILSRIKRNAYLIVTGHYHPLQEHVEHQINAYNLIEIEKKFGPAEGKHSIIKLNGSNSTNPSTHDLNTNLVFLAVQKIQ